MLLPGLGPGEHQPNSNYTYVRKEESHLEKVDEYVQGNPTAKGEPRVVKIENKCVATQHVLEHADN
jgi:hypothetical protein